MRRYFCVSVLFSVLVFAFVIGSTVTIAFAQESGSFEGDVTSVVTEPSIEPSTYGTASQTVMIIGAHMFGGRASAYTMQPGGGVDRYLDAGGYADAHPVLPNGAVIEKIELRACDTSGTAEVNLMFGFCDTPGAGCTLAGGVSTGVAATPGCGNFPLTLSSPVQVDNQNPILAEVDTGNTAATTFSAVKIYYRLQISPAPGTATFSDVPTDHPFFQHIEALAASGITTGYGDGTFRPGDYVTRQAMAAFLARALGLHWPN